MRWHLSLAARVRLYGLQREAARQELQHPFGHVATYTQSHGRPRQLQGGEQAEEQQRSHYSELKIFLGAQASNLKFAATAVARRCAMLLSTRGTPGTSVTLVLVLLSCYGI